MPRVARCVHSSKYQDQRDYFPFHFVDDPFDPLNPHSPYRPVNWSFEKAFKYIHRIRQLRFTVVISCFDKIDEEQRYSDFGIKADRVMTAGPGEQGIRESFRKNYEWPGWLYDPLPTEPTPDTKGFVDLGYETTPPLIYYGENVFGPYLQFGAYIEGGLDAGTIASISTIKHDSSWKLSQVQATYFGEGMLVYEQINESFTDGPVTGYVTIDPTSWWSYNGIYATTVDHQIIFPTPTGF